MRLSIDAAPIDEATMSWSQSITEQQQVDGVRIPTVVTRQPVGIDIIKEPPEGFSFTS